MDMPGHAAGGVAVTDAIRENHASVLSLRRTPRKDRRLCRTGGYGDDIAFQSCQVQRAVRSLITGPQFHTAERPHCGSRAIKLLGSTFLNFILVSMLDGLFWFTLCR